MPVALAWPRLHHHLIQFACRLVQEHHAHDPGLFEAERSWGEPAHNDPHGVARPLDTNPAKRVDGLRVDLADALYRALTHRPTVGPAHGETSLTREAHACQEQQGQNDQGAGHGARSSTIGQEPPRGDNRLPCPAFWSCRPGLIRHQPDGSTGLHSRPVLPYWTLSSAGSEHYFDRVGVTGSNPVASTLSM